MAVSSTVALVAALAAAAASAYNTQQTAKKQDRNAAAGIREQAKNQREINQRINRTVEETSKSSSKPEKTRDAAQYIATVAKQMGQARAGLATRGLSAEYDKEANSAGQDVSDYGANLSDLFARMDAPVQQRQRELTGFGNLGMDLGVLGTKVGSDDFLTRLKGSMIRRSGGLDFLSGALGAIAGAPQTAGGNTAMHDPPPTKPSGYYGYDDNPNAPAWRNGP